MQTTAAPFLMFEGKAQEAIDFYVSVLPDSRIVSIDRYGPGEPGPEGTVKLGRASIAGLTLLFSDSYVKHAFTFTPSISLFVTCRSEEEIERLSVTLAKGGAELMPLASYGFSRKFAWVNDRFGVSWQLNLE
jgi:predicted 3-demethylubiquinone-9 3-methyltransferase (glyoxalase superfamily)